MRSRLSRRGLQWSGIGAAIAFVGAVLQSLDINTRNAEDAIGIVMSLIGVLVVASAGLVNARELRPVAHSADPRST